MVEDNKQSAPLTKEEIEAIELRTENEDDLFNEKVETVETDDETRIPVSYENAEEALLSMFIQDDDIATLIAQSGLRDLHFLKRKNKVMFPLILNVRFAKGVCNYDLVADQLEKESMPDGQSVLDFVGGLEELSKVIECTPPIMDVRVAQSYIDIIFEQFKMSKIKDTVRLISSLRKYDESKIVEKIATIQQIVSDNTSNKYGLVALTDLLSDAYARYEDRKANPEKYKGIGTGFYWLDKYQAVAKKHVCVVGARTSVGKSVFVSNILTRILLEDYKLLLFTPELDRREYIDRLICAEASVEIDRWKEGVIDKADNIRIGKAQNKLLKHASNLYVEDKGSQSCAFILNSIRKHMLNHKVDVVVVDYLQKLRYYGDNTKRSITDMMEKFCSFAKDNDIAFIVLSQLRRSDKPEPELSDLKESGDIENFADSVVLLHRNSITKHEERNKGWYKLAKNRQGGTTDNVTLTFWETTLKFTEPDRPEDGVDAQGTLIGGYDDEIPDEDRPTEQKVVETIMKEQGTL